MPVAVLFVMAIASVGIYGIVRFDIDMLGPGPMWWSVLLLVIGGASAV
mgnify:CR=1 FL=1